MQHIVIIGNGIAGITTARHLRKLSDHRITVISDEAEHFFSRTALMYVYMGHMRWKDIKPYEDWFWEKNRIELRKARVNEVDPQARLLHLANGTQVTYDKLVLATGSRTSTFGWPGLDLDGVQGLVHKQDLESLEIYAPNKEICKRAVIVGGGLIGVELAEMLRTRDFEVTFLVREDAFWTGVLPKGEAAMISRHIASHGVDLRHNTELEAILGDENGRVRAVTTTGGETIECQLVGITTGVRPNISFLKGSGIETDKGILVDRQLQTNIEDVYAIGDCAQQRESIGLRPAVEAVWYTGRMMGEALAHTLAGQPTEYQPGIWFNSAKFFDIEYQTYGWVFPDRKRKDYETQFHWKHPGDQHCITLSFHKDTGEFLGINTFGIRLRHTVMDRWLREKRNIEYVLTHFRDANFDPEFYDGIAPALIAAFNEQFNSRIRLAKKRTKSIFSL